MGLQVELPMVLHMDNVGAVDLVNDWSAGGRTRHMEMCMFFLRNLKEAGIIEPKWKRGDQHMVDMLPRIWQGSHLTSAASYLFEKISTTRGTINYRGKGECWSIMC
eukprot:4460065-Ditylum_brightwellii.AAC.1